MKPIHERPGAQLLIDYRRHGSGIDLFRAYLERRQADHQKNLQWLSLDFNTIPGNEADDALETRIFLNILDALDPVIKDVVKFCETPGPGDDQLPNVRSALRIGKHHAPGDAERQKSKWSVVALWVQAYLKMQQVSAVYKSETLLKKEIAIQSGVSQSTALNHWNELKTTEPWQAKWAKEIEVMSKGRQIRALRATQKSTPKPVGKPQKLRFGKGV